MCGVCALLRLALAEIRRSNTRSGGCGALLDFPAQTLRSYLVFLEGLAVSSVTFSCGRGANSLWGVMSAHVWLRGAWGSGLALALLSALPSLMQ